MAFAERDRLRPVPFFLVHRINFRSQEIHREHRTPPCPILLSLSPIAFLLSGCTASHVSPATTSRIALAGKLYGGEQPIFGSVIHLYAVNESIVAGASTDLLTTTVTTDSNGNFNYSGDYSCPTPNTLVYLAAVGGDSGALANNAVQTSLAAVGACSSLATTNYFVLMNEVTTVATVRGLKGYIADYDHIGATDLSALTNAFTTVTEYANINTGTAPGAALPTGYDASSNDLRTLANIVQTCVNSTGSIASDQPCGTFFTLAQGTAQNAPADTIQALVDIFNTPTNNVAALFARQPATPAFLPNDSAAPIDWSLPILQLPSTPVFSPAGGTFTAAQTVGITDSNPAAVIYYTTDGTTPTASSSIYSGPITLSASTTLNAVAIVRSRLVSGVTSGIFTITSSSPTLPAVSLSSITVGAGTTTPVTITATSSIDGYVVTFGDDGSIDGTFSPTKCTITAGSCSVSYIPTGSLAVGTYTNALAARFDGSANSELAYSTLTLTPSYNYTLLHSLGTTDGIQPYDGLIQAADGNFYGTTSEDGYLYGTVFKMTPAGVFSVLHDFASDGSEGVTLYGGVVQGSDGSFYGTAEKGGANGDGTVFKITSSGAFTLLHSFTGTDGSIPMAELLQASEGNFCGTTYQGGENGDGTVFKITPTGTFTLLHSFIGTDGNEIWSALIQGADGSLYGTLSSGGTTSVSTVYKITTAGVFTSIPPTQGTNIGAGSVAPLFLASDGNFYGTTSAGAAGAEGTVFQLTPSGTMTSIHSFSGEGYFPYAGLVQGMDGSLYGTTHLQDGNIFKIAPVPVLSAPVVISAPSVVTPGASFSLTATVSNAYSTTLKTCFASVTSSSGVFTNLGAVTGSTTSTNTTLTAPSTSGSYTLSLTCGGQESSNTPLTVQGTAALPLFSLAAGTYTGPQTVSITSATSPATIYYTVDGSTPTTSSLVYTSPLTVSSSMTIKALTVATGYTNSPVNSAAYIITSTTALLSNVTSDYGSTTPQTLTASSPAEGSVVTFGTAGSIGGSFSPTTCTIAAGICSVNYTPSATLAAGPTRQTSPQVSTLPAVMQRPPLPVRSSLLRQRAIRSFTLSQAPPSPAPRRLTVPFPLSDSFKARMAISMARPMPVELTPSARSSKSLSMAPVIACSIPLPARLSLARNS
ncbi:MAG: chitobiase/beta-hexosaminidase C-terminal domain-containing protein [Acidobacteriaceae bacterium]|nr:chitobiase/beta-hexosaminidase C-terminal domain-containing protein [Acidobacteriaceae bacterium]